MIDVATAQEIVNFVGQLMPQRGHATLKAANEALDNISETSDTENVDLEGPFRDLPIPYDMDERDVAVNRQDNLLQYGVRRLAFVQCLTGAEIPEENLNNVFTPEGSNAYPVLKVYSHSIERNAISFGALCPTKANSKPRILARGQLFFPSHLGRPVCLSSHDHYRRLQQQTLSAIHQQIGSWPSPIPHT